MGSVGEMVRRRASVGLRFSERAELRIVAETLTEGFKVRLEDLVGVQQLMSGVVIVKFKTEEVYLDFLRCYEGRGRSTALPGLHVDVEDYSRQATYVSVRDAPLELGSEHIVEVLGGYGKVLGHRRNRFAGAYFPGLETGVRTFRMCLSSAVPSSIVVMGCRLRVLYEGQPRTCYRCGGVGHVAAACGGGHARGPGRRWADVAAGSGFVSCVSVRDPLVAPGGGVALAGVGVESGVELDPVLGTVVREREVCSGIGAATVVSGVGMVVTGDGPEPLGSSPPPVSVPGVVSDVPSDIGGESPGSNGIPVVAPRSVEAPEGGGFGRFDSVGVSAGGLPQPGVVAGGGELVVGSEGVEVAEVERKRRHVSGGSSEDGAPLGPGCVQLAVSRDVGIDPSGGSDQWCVFSEGAGVAPPPELKVILRKKVCVPKGCSSDVAASRVVVEVPEPVVGSGGSGVDRVGLEVASPVEPVVALGGYVGPGRVLRYGLSAPPGTFQVCSSMGLVLAWKSSDGECFLIPVVEGPVEVVSVPVGVELVGVVRLESRVVQLWRSPGVHVSCAELWSPRFW